MSQDQSLAVIDATDAQVFTGRQGEELDKCQFHLDRLRKQIKTKENEVIYLYVESGWWFLRAKAIHRVETVSTRPDGRFLEQEDAGFMRWFEGQKFSFSYRTAQNWMRAAEFVGLAVESTILALQTIREEKRLHGKALKDLRPPKRHEPAVEIIDKRSPDEDTIRESVRLDWEDRQEQLKTFYDGWIRATGYHFSDETTWMEIPEKEVETLEWILNDALYKVREFRKQQEARRQNLRRQKQPESEPAKDKTKPPPTLKHFKFGFDQPRASRKLKGSRWFYGYRTPEGKINLLVYRGKTTEAAAEEFKKEHPALQLVGPFHSTSTRYAKQLVKDTLSGKIQSAALADMIGGELIQVSK